MAHIRSRIVNGVAEALSAPTRFIQARRGGKADYKRSIVTDARGYDNAPNFDERGGVTDAFKTRSLRKDIKRAD